jgi:hypothetical protein
MYVTGLRCWEGPSFLEWLYVSPDSFTPRF